MNIMKNNMAKFFISSVYWGWNNRTIPTPFAKCTRWQAEETLDPIHCPYHYYCDRAYPSSYPPITDTGLIFFTLTLYLITFTTMIMETSLFSSTQTRLVSGRFRKYMLPSSPISLSIVLFTMAQLGNRIDAVLPVGPAIFHLVLISAIAFDSGADTDSDIKHAFFEMSKVSGILHLCLDLDSVLVPYYTGYDALLSSTLSGECDSCICRDEALVVGGTAVSYRAWSITAFVVFGALCSRIICIRASHKLALRLGNVVKCSLELLSLMLIVVDSSYLLRYSPPDRVGLRVAAFGAQLVFVSIHLSRTIQIQIRRSRPQLQEKHLTA